MFSDRNSLDAAKILDHRALSGYLFAMTVTVSILILLFCHVGIAASASKSDVEIFIASGDRYYRDFDNVAALRQYRKAYELAPTDFAALVRMVRVHNDIGRSMLWRDDSAEVWYHKAVDYAEELIAAYPEKADSHFWLALTKGSLVPFSGVQQKLDIGKFVVRHARKAVEIDSTFAPAYVVLGILYREAAKLKWYERVIANVVFGGSLPGTIEDSERVLQRAVDLNPKDIFAHYELSRTYQFLEEEEKAVHHLREALALQPSSKREKDQQRRAARQLERMKTEG